VRSSDENLDGSGTGSPWVPLFSQLELREDAIQCVVTAAAALRNPRSIELAAELTRLQTPLPRTAVWSPLSISQGWTGLAIACGALDSCFPEQGWDETAHRYLTLAAPSVDDQSCHPGLFSGLAGIAFAAYFLSKKGLRYQKLLGFIEDRLCDELDARSVHDDFPFHGVRFDLFDLISGWTGIIAYLLERRDDPRLAKHLVALLERLARLLNDGQDVPAWHTPSSLCADKELAAQHPNGFLNCGLAHGIPGPLAVLSLARLAGVVAAGLDEGIRKSAEWLVAHQIEDAWGINWPSVVPLGVPRSQWMPSRTAWCYGSPGVARSLWLAGRALHERSWQALAINSMEAVFRRPQSARGIFSPTFCHGLAGLLSVAMRFAHERPTEGILLGIQSLGRELVRAFDRDAPLGYRSEDVPGVFVDRPGLLEGAPGVILALLAGSTAVEPTWDRLFLLS
jgi:hypothetical protein